MNAWEKKDSKFQRLFVFNDFNEALDFVNEVGRVAEKIKHHPDITLQNYKEVFITTTTHSAGNIITEKDHELIVAINKLC